MDKIGAHILAVLSHARQNFLIQPSRASGSLSFQEKVLWSKIFNAGLD
jgi:hypothetical protein